MTIIRDDLSPATDGGLSKAAIWTGRALSGIAIVFLLMDGGIKLIPLDVVIETSKQMGIPTELVRTLGVLTLTGAILYAIPRTAVFGAIILTGYLGGAIYAHVLAKSPLFSHTLFSIYLACFVWGGLWLRDPLVRALIPFRRN